MRPAVDEDARKRAARRAGAAAAAAVFHVLFVILLIESEWFPGLQGRRPAEPPILWLLLPKTAGTPNKLLPHAQKGPEQEVPRFYSLPITLPPPVNAIDPALALGRALACGANSFEYLTPQGRAQCTLVPWHYKFDRYGTIVLDTQYKPPVPKEPKISGAEALARERNTADPCLAAKSAGTECVDKIIFGNGH